MVLEPLEAWSSHRRSQARLPSSPRVQLCDPSAATALLRARPDQVLADVRCVGYLFERSSFVTSECSMMPSTGPCSTTETPTTSRSMPSSLPATDVGRRSG